ncbi:probable apyrase 5 [Selaginella moellendorffii]|nr:probable apyrase 5 [Selaginella moellendorffii]|eukprot:XP_002971296.2 probable apyrase 5 [Selaginella moellendorffii]
MNANGLGFMRRSSGATASTSASSSAATAAAESSSGRMDFAKLQSRPSSAFVPPHKTQLPPRYHLSLSSGGGAASHSHRQQWQRRIWGAVTLILAVSALFYFFSVFGGPRRQQNSRGHAIVIDAGSSGSRLHIFSYKVEKLFPHIDTQDIPSLKTKPGLSSFSSNPQQAGESLVELLDFANARIAKKDRGQTRLYLMATAGLRRLEKNIQDDIIESCRSVLRKSDFMFEDSWASVITGTEEGIFAWVSANYALGTLGGDPHATTGIVELGGASAQVTFVPDSPFPPEFLHSLEFGGVNYKLYTYSFLHFGQEAAWDNLLQLLLSGAVKPRLKAKPGVVIDPCTPAGYVMNSELLEKIANTLPGPNQVKVSTVLSSGNFSECRRAAQELLQMGEDQCLHERCAIGSTFVPDLRGKFFATENFFYTSEFFGLPATTSLADVEAAGDFYCGEQWTKLKDKHVGIQEEDLLKYCFSTAYIVALLHDRLGIAMHDERVRFTNKVGNVPLDWALGALMVKLADNIEERSEWSFGDDWVTILSFFGSFGLVFVLVWLVLRCRKPRLKTIYDLEKGRYITTTRLHR